MHADDSQICLVSRGLEFNAHAEYMERKPMIRDQGKTRSLTKLISKDSTKEKIESVYFNISFYLDISC